MVIGVGVSTCRLDDLFKAPPGGELIAGGTLDRSAAHGSKAIVIGKIPVSNTGNGVLTWEAKPLGSSNWFSIQNPSGESKTDSVRLLLNPAGLDTGTYTDSVSITSDVGGTATVLVNWTIVPCQPQGIQIAGEELSDTLTLADCGAPHNAGKQAQIFSVNGGHQGDVVTVLLSSSAFNGFVALETSLDSAVPPLDTATECLGDPKNPCIYYFTLPSTATYYIEVSGATPGDTGLFTVRLISGGGRDPNRVQSLEQRLLPDSSQVVAIGGAVTANVLIHGVVSDSDLVDSLRLQVEWAPIGTNFQGVVMSTGPYTHNGQVASVTLGPLQDNTAYHWQVRAVDQRGNFSSGGTQWDSLARGSSPDFTVQIGHDPSLPTNLVQLQSDGVQQIQVGGYANTTTVKFSGTVVDQDPGDQLHLEVEAEPIFTDTTGTPTQPQTWTTVSTGGTSVATLIAIVDRTSYHWIARAVDQGGRHSKWVSFGSNAESQTDFRDSVLNNVNLVFTTQPPSSVTAGVAMSQVVVTAQDALGNTINGFTNPVTMSASGPGTLSGTTTVNAVAGRATFSNLILTKTGSYTLLATSGVTNSQPSSPITVTPAAVTQLVFTQPPSSATAGVPFSPTVQVAGEDQFFNANPSFTGLVSLAIATNGGNPPGTLRGTTSVNAVAGTGVASFPTVNIDKIGSGYTLRAGASGVTPDTSGPFTITAAPVTHLVFATQPSNTAAGIVIVPAVQVAGHDSLENTVPSFTSNVTVAIGANPGGGTLGGTLTQAASAGVANFGNLSINKTGTNYTLLANSGALPQATSAFFSIISSPVDSTKSTVSASSPITACAASCTPGGGTASQILITVHDGSDNAVVGANVSLSATGAGVISFTQPAPTNALGQTTGTMWSDSVGPKVVTAVAQGIGIASHPTVTVTPGPAASLAFSTQPGTTGAGAAINSGTGVVVLAKDQLGNTANFSSTVQMAIAAGPGPFAPTSTDSAPMSAGMATFSNLRIYLVGTGYQLRASTGGLPASPPSTAFNITVGPAVRDTFTVQPVTTAVLARIDSAQGGVKVSVTDSVGNIVTTDNTHQVTMAIFNGPGGATLGGTKTRPVQTGTAVFTDLTLDKLGTYQLNAVSNLTGNPSDISTSFDIIPGPAKTLVFKTQPPASPTAGTAFGATVAALDIAGDTATSFTGNVTLSLNPSSGNLSGTTTVAAVGGFATFTNLNVAIAGTYTLTAAASGVTNGTSSSFTVQSGLVSASKSTVQALPPIDTACASSCSPAGLTASQITITALDGNGNPITTGLPVTVTITGSGNTPTSPVSGTTDGSGQFLVTLSSTVSEVKTISAVINGISITQQATVSVVPASPAVLAFTRNPPASATAGAAISPAVQVTVRDAFGNRVTFANNSITLSFLQTGRGTLSNNVAAASAGIATFTTLNATKATTTGSGQTQLLTPDSLIATATNLTPDTSSGFAVNPAAVSAGTSTLTTPQTTDSACSTSCTTVGVTASILTVTAKDQFSNVIQGLTVSMSSTGGPGNNFTAPPNTNSSGVSTSTFNSTKAEAKTISATVGGVLITPTAPVTVTVIPAGVSASHSNLSAGQSSITACQTSCTVGGGTGSLISVTAKDAFDNLIQGAKVVLSSTGSNPAFNPAPPNTNSSGVSTSTFSSTTAEGKTISGTLQVGSGSIVSITPTAGVTVIPGTATQLAFTSEPTTTNQNATINPAIVVTAFDQFGNVATGYTGTVTLTITPGTPATGGPGGLSGTNPVSAVNGVATFNGMSMSDTGTGYTLDASDGSLTVTSTVFNIN